MYSARRGAVTGAVLWEVRAAGEHRVLPDGALDLMWHEGRLTVAGPDATATSVRAEPGSRTFGLRFPPGVAPLLLGVPAGDLVNRRVALADLVTGTPGAGPDLLEHVYVDLWRRADPDPGLIRLAALLDRGARRGVPVARLAGMVGLTERSLRRTSRDLFGYGLKTLSGIRRFQRAHELVQGGAALAAAAAEAGYADQAHMTREITRFAGITPGRLRTASTRSP
ncbi:helix-turn-helix transcriptional regulator [Amycolatopsis alkalitolerans]|uniref:Helix-turn-helix transcriptional regulator n=1 Tax=Amycolatopsis alkalitolerans TaxID=2547244 RepID=A0A5C4LY93_9PSEU|nr:helix-turn-helix transcriptional regulator [Amycolatopsis alkalitolerans]